MWLLSMGLCKFSESRRASLSCSCPRPSRTSKPDGLEFGPHYRQVEALERYEICLCFSCGIPCWGVVCSYHTSGYLGRSGVKILGFNTLNSGVRKPRIVQQIPELCQFECLCSGSFAAPRWNCRSTVGHQRIGIMECRRHLHP